MKTSKLFKALQRFDSKLDLQQTKEGVIVGNSDYKILSFLQNNRSLHNGMISDLICNS